MDQYLSQIIGMNPTGQLDYSGTFTMNGPNEIHATSDTIAKENLIKKQNGEFICNEPFKNEDSSIYPKIMIFLWILFLIILLYIIYYILSKKKY